MDDLDETLQDDIQAGEEQLQGDLYSAYLEEDIDFEQRGEILLETQKLSLAPRTLKGYTTLHKQFVDYIIKRFPQQGRTNLDTASKECPQYIIDWIAYVCQENGSSRKKKLVDSSRTRDRPATYSHALKMRAAASFWFTSICPQKCSPTAWVQIHSTKEWQGNPSLSATVSKYMKGLYKTKAQGGEVQMSSRAITSSDLRAMWKFNQKIAQLPAGKSLVKDRDINKPLVHDDHIYRWSGPTCRKMMQTIYTLAFKCLLRIEEVLKIQAHHIHVLDEKKGIIKVDLLFRKTDQFGGIKPFVLYLDVKEPHLCPVRALLEWIKVSRIMEGFLFRRVDVWDRVVQRNVPLTAQQFTEFFRHNLLDIGIDFRLYGTHSFRRGGAQWLYTEKRWGLPKICDWGGWSTDWSASSIMRYLCNWNDDPMMVREDYMNPDHKGSSKCYTCGRECACIGR